MKMSPTLFASLKVDINAVFVHHGVDFTILSKEDVRVAFYKVMFDRQNDNDHPAFQKGRKRILSHMSEKRWLDQFYKDENLNDEHINTALRKILKELKE